MTNLANLPIVNCLAVFSASVLGSPSAGQIFFQELSKYIPPFFMEYLCEHSSDPRCVLVRAIRETVVGVSQELVKKREESLRLGEHYDDALGLLGELPRYTLT